MNRSSPALLSLLLMVVQGCSEAHPVTATREPRPPRVARTLTEAVVGSRSVTPTLTFMATVRAARDATLSAQLGGRVERMNVQLGDAVAFGTELVRLRDDDARLAAEGAHAVLAQAKARLGGVTDPGRVPDVQAARVNYDLAVDAHKRAEDLAQKGSLSEQELLRARSAEEMARVQLDAAKAQAVATVAQVRQASAAFSQSRLTVKEMGTRAPFDGVVIELMAKVNETLAPGSPIVRMVDVKTLELEFDVPQHEAAQVLVGATVSVPTDAADGRGLEGKIQRMSAGLTGEARARRVLASFAQPAEAARHVLPGARVRVAVFTGAPVARAVVPRSAVRSLAGVSRVFVMKDGKIAARLLELERLDGDSVLVRSGVDPGEHVVSSPPLDLEDGEDLAR